MKFAQLGKYIEKIDNTNSRLSITQLLSEIFLKLKSDEIDKTTYLLMGRIGPLYESVDFGMAEKTVIKSVVKALNLEKKLFENKYKEIGDLGKTAEYFKKIIKSFDEKDLEITEVYDELYRLAKASGEGSQELKINILANLIRQLDSQSVKYLVRIPMGIMRLGFSDMTVLDALSWMLADNKTLRPRIEKAYHVRPDLGFIASLIKKEGIRTVESIKPKLFTPILMMRAERLSSGEEIIDKIGKCAIEPKYDGFRIQAHYKKSENQIKLYSRNLDDVSFMYPDLIEGIKKEIIADEIIFEGEAIGYSPQTGRFLPFQETVQRKRKYDISEKAKEIPLKLFVFDILYVDGKSLINTPYIERRKRLEKIIKITGKISKDAIVPAPHSLVDSAVKIEALFEEALGNDLEGIIAKRLDGIYQPGARGWNWIKFKRSYSSKIEDTIDCLVMGYDKGKGKRAQFGIGAFLVGIYDEKQDKFLTVAKIGTGLTDNEWIEIKKRADKLISEKKPSLYDVDKMMEVDVWVKPGIIVEIKADEITRSPVHTGELALRFPRLEKFRDDKRPEEATTFKELQSIFKSQGSQKISEEKK